MVVWSQGAMKRLTGVMGARRTSDWASMARRWSNEDQSNVVPLGVSGRSRRSTYSPLSPWSTAGWDGKTHIALERSPNRLHHPTPGLAIAHLTGEDIRLELRGLGGFSLLRLATAFLLALSAILGVILIAVLLG